jgi:hypothetical protein
MLGIVEVAMGTADRLVCVAGALVGAVSRDSALRGFRRPAISG